MYSSVISGVEGTLVYMCLLLNELKWIYILITFSGGHQVDSDR